MYLGDPGVIIKINSKVETPINYDFVTSIIVDTDRGPVNTPVLINSIEDYNYYFGKAVNESRRYVLSFLQYSPSLLVMRSVQDTPLGALPNDPGTYNASSISTTTPYDRIRIDNLDQFHDLDSEDFLNDNLVRVIARSPGNIDNIKVAVFNIEQYKNNVLVYSGIKDYKAKDLINSFTESSYCVVVFRDEEPIETFLVPFDDVSKINEYSNEIFIEMAYDETLNEYHDGNIQFFDGNFGYYDGNEFNILAPSNTFIGNSVIELSGGESLKPVSALTDTAEILADYPIDIHIAYNVSVQSDELVNIVSTPSGVRQAIDFAEVYNSLNKTPKMFIYGIKKLDNVYMGLEADYAGLRSRTVLTKGLGVSSSKVAVPFNLNILKTNPSLSEMDELYYNNINPVHRYRGTIYCNGELIS